MKESPEQKYKTKPFGKRILIAAVTGGIAGIFALLTTVGALTTMLGGILAASFTIVSALFWCASAYRINYREALNTPGNPFNKTEQEHSKIENKTHGWAHKETLRKENLSKNNLSNIEKY